MACTWNPSDKSAGWTLSEGDLRAASAASTGDNGVRGTVSRTTGKWYYEFRPNSGYGVMGFASAAQVLNATQFGADTALWLYPNGYGGGIYSDGTFQSFSGLDVADSDWAGIAVDLDAGLFWVRPVAGWDGDPAAGTGGYSIANLATLALFPFFGTVDPDAVDANANFGASAFTYSVPTGFTAWAATHDTSGTLTGPGAVLAGSANRFRAFATSGALVGQGALMTGSAAHIANHQTSGALTGQGSAISGTASSFTVHTSSGALVGPGAAMFGVASRQTPGVIAGLLQGLGLYLRA